MLALLVGFSLSYPEQAEGGNSLACRPTALASPKAKGCQFEEGIGQRVWQGP